MKRKLSIQFFSLIIMVFFTSLLLAPVSAQDAGVNRIDVAKVSQPCAANVMQHSTAGLVASATGTATAMGATCHFNSPDDYLEIILTNPVDPTTISFKFNGGNHVALLDKPLATFYDVNHRKIGTFTGTNQVDKEYFAIIPGAQVKAIYITYNAPSMVKNGSFEEPTSTDISDLLHVLAGGTDIADWVVGGFSVDWKGTFWNAAEGNRSIDLSGDDAGELHQDVTGLTTGEWYDLRFALSGNPGGTDPIKAVVVNIGDKAETFVYPAHSNTANNMEWIYRTMRFQATAETMKLSFISQNASNAGPAIDDVSIIEGKFCSRQATVEERFDITFTNNSNETVTVNWISSDCEEILHANIDAGVVSAGTSFPGHNFIVRDSTGRIINEFGVVAHVTDYVIAAAQN